MLGSAKHNWFMRSVDRRLMEDRPSDDRSSNGIELADADGVTLA
jgi:hypothetical protein